MCGASIMHENSKRQWYSRSVFVCYLSGMSYERPHIVATGFVHYFLFFRWDYLPRIYVYRFRYVSNSNCWKTLTIRIPFVKGKKQKFNPKLCVYNVRTYTQILFFFFVSFRFRAHSTMCCVVVRCFRFFILKLLSIERTIDRSIDPALFRVTISFNLLLNQPNRSISLAIQVPSIISAWNYFGCCWCCCCCCFCLCCWRTHIHTRTHFSISLSLFRSINIHQCCCYVWRYIAFVAVLVVIIVVVVVVSLCVW